MGDVMTEAGVGVMHLEDGGRGHQPRNVGGFGKLETSGNRFSPRASRKNPSLWTS